jgi:hypothetical protein
MNISKFRLSLELTVGINIAVALVWLHCSDVGNIVEKSEVHFTFIFRVNTWRADKFLCE